MSVKEYKEARQEAEKLEAENAQLKDENENISQELAETKAILEKVNKKKVRLIEVESIQTKPTIFGNKVTIDKDDYDKIYTLAEKEIISVRQTKKLSTENQKLVEENTELKKTVNKQAVELAKYQKPTTISIKQLKEEDLKLRENENLKLNYKKAISFIDAYGLSDEFCRYRPNTRNNEEKLL